MIDHPHAHAEMLRIKGHGTEQEWLVRVDYQEDYYLVLIRGEMVTVYKEREMPDGHGEIMRRPTNLTSHSAAAIECVRRIKYGDHD